MKVQQSTVGMSGTYTFTEGTCTEEALKAWVGHKRPDFEGKDSVQSLIPMLSQDTVDLSQKARGLRLEGLNEEDIALTIDDADKQKIILLRDMLEKLTGKKFKFYTVDKIRLRDPGKGLTITPVDFESSGVQLRQGWGIEYDFHETHFEKETMSFNSSGMVRTADGREINFSVQLNMSREFTSSKSVHLRAGDAALVDPLVINFGGKSPVLSNSTFSFDLDCDGNPDQVHNLVPSSGFLALDLNNDGIINDGRELFGPKSGDGFNELSKYDSDANGWIDENDPIFNKLRIWVKDGQGTDRLFALGMKGIGAIYVGNVDTRFDIKDSGNSLMGQIRETGIFLNENGTAGTIQHIDIVV